MTPSKGSILLVEDSPTQAERVRLLLEMEGYRVDVAPNGREGLKRARTAPPDLIISDILMPEMDGYAFCRAIRQSDATRRVPFIFFTERHAPMDIIEGLVHGADNFIPKSSSEEYLLARVRRIFEQLDHRKAGEVAIEILVRVDGREIPISADKQQIFELLISSVEEAGRVNGELSEARRLLQEDARQLEARVQARTAELAATLKEREVLLQEVHHRVTNNLQVISSLMNMQIRSVQDPAGRDALEECRSRVQVMALIHEKLYQSKDYACVPFSAYTKSLAAHIFHATGTPPEAISLELAIEDLALPVDKAIPCGLILNELITNALKHAFPDGRTGTIQVALAKVPGRHLRLAVCDDGVGLSRDFDVGTSGSLGLQLVRMLARQVDADLEVKSDRGTSFAVTIPVEALP